MLTYVLSQLGARNQELLEQSLVVREQVRHMEASSSDKTVALSRRLITQLSLCFSELQALVQVCSQRAEGQDPDISVLLGVNSEYSRVLRVHEEFCDKYN